MIWMDVGGMYVVWVECRRFGWSVGDVGGMYVVECK